MNELEALELSIKLWQDIVDNNYSAKRQSQYYGEVSEMFADCPLCEFYLIKDGKMEGSCNGCVLAERHSFSFEDFPCIDDGAVYKSWCYASQPSRRKKIAQSIVDRMVIRRDALINKVGK